MKLAVSVLPDILVAVREGIGALAVTLTVPVLTGILMAVGIGGGGLAIRPTGGRHIGITWRQGALPKGWHGQTNEKGENDSHWHILTRGHT